MVLQRKLRLSIARVNVQLDPRYAASKHTTAPINHTVSFHQMAPPLRGSKHPITAYYSVCRLRKDERLSRPGLLVTYWNKVPPPGVEPGHVTHPSTNWARRRVTSLIRPTFLTISSTRVRCLLCCLWWNRFLADVWTVLRELLRLTSRVLRVADAVWRS